MLPGCRTPSDDLPYYCVCPLKNDPIKFKSLFEMASVSANSTENSASNVFPTVKANSADVIRSDDASNSGSDGGGLSGGAIAGIVIGVVVSLFLRLYYQY